MGPERRLGDGVGHWGWSDNQVVWGAQGNGASPWGAGQVRHTQASCQATAYLVQPWPFPSLSLPNCVPLRSPGDGVCQALIVPESVTSQDGHQRHLRTYGTVGPQLGRALGLWALCCQTCWPFQKGSF